MKGKEMEEFMRKHYDLDFKNLPLIKQIREEAMIEILDNVIDYCNDVKNCSYLKLIEFLEFKKENLEIKKSSKGNKGKK